MSSFHSGDLKVNRKSGRRFINNCHNTKETIRAQNQRFTTGGSQPESGSQLCGQFLGFLFLFCMDLTFWIFKKCINGENVAHLFCRTTFQ